MYLNRRQMEMSQKTAEEEERYRKEMEKYIANFVFNIALVSVNKSGTFQS